MPIDQSVSYVFLFDPIAKELVPTPKADLKDNEVEFKIGRVSSFATRVVFTKEGLHIFGKPLEAEGRLTKLGKMVGIMCKDVHVRMREGEMIPIPRKRVQLSYH